MARAAWVSVTLIISGLLGIFAPGQASAGFCSSTSCGLTLTNSDFIGSGTFGTVNLALSSNVVTIDVNLARPYRIVKTGFPGAVGSANNLGGGPTMGNVSAQGASPASRYTGYQSSTPGCNTSECRGNGIGYANNAASTAAASPRRLGFQQLSFALGRATSITDIRQLLQQSGGRQGGPAYFAAAACAWDPKKLTCGETGGLLRSLRSRSPRT
jgi:hypothetical protein